MPLNRFFQAGGSLSVNLPSYVERKADKDLYQHLVQGDFCYVLTARQMGKSSLKVRMMNRLAKEDWATASIDLTSFGTTGFTVEQWYLSFLSEIADALDIDEYFDKWWDRNLGITPVARMSHFWEEVLLTHITQPIIIFIDEVDSILSLDDKSFSTDDFFAAIRAVYNKRSENVRFQRLNFVIFGVAAPEDLMGDHERTPFNIGIPIPLNNFSLKETFILTNGFSNDVCTNKKLLERIMYWTAGQPYLTQELCQNLSQIKCNKDQVSEIVDQIIEKLFLEFDVFNSPHFSNIQTRILGNDSYKLKMLDIYEKVVNDGKFHLSRKDKGQLYLKLSGLVKESGGHLEVNNRIYDRVFDSEWLRKSYDSIQRPFTIDLQRWIDTEKSKDALLKGSLLKEAEDWASSREDLTSTENDFLQASRLADLEAEKELLLQAEKERQRKRLKYALIVVIFFSILSITMGYFAVQQAKFVETEKGLKRAESIARRKAVLRSDSLDILLKERNEALYLAEKERERNRVLAEKESEAKSIAIQQKAIVEQTLNKLTVLNNTLSTQRRQLQGAKKSLELQRDLAEEQKAIAQLVAESRRAYFLIISSLEERKDRPELSFRLAEAAFNLNKSDYTIKKNLFNSFYDGLKLNHPKPININELEHPIVPNSKAYEANLKGSRIILKDFRSNELQIFNINFKVKRILFTLNNSHLVVESERGKYYGWVIDPMLLTRLANSENIQSISAQEKFKYGLN